MKKFKLRSKEWFDNPNDPGLTALYLERYLNYGLTRKQMMFQLNPSAEWCVNKNIFSCIIDVKFIKTHIKY